MYKIFLTTKASREYKKLPKQTELLIYEHLQSLANDPFSRAFDVEKLKLPFVGYRLRVGEWRVLYKIAGEIMEIYSVKNRKDAYKK